MTQRTLNLHQCASQSTRISETSSTPIQIVNPALINGLAVRRIHGVNHILSLHGRLAQPVDAG
jgi:hypothetical protein